MKNRFVLSLSILFYALIAIASQVSPSYKFTPFDSPEFCSQIITSTCNTTLSVIDDLNNEIRPRLSDLVQTSYFKFFKLNFDKQCKFWDAQHFCATENCAVEILPPSQYNWSSITNDNLKPSKLGQIKKPESTGELTLDEDTCEDLDYTHIDDDHHCVYVNLVDNPERFTGYGGNQSFDVWKAIYSENCFPNTNPRSMTKGGEVESCTEKNLFYRLISGMHASIAVHLSNEYLSPKRGEFEPNLQVFMERVGSFNDRLSNIYFNYALVSQAIVKLSEFLSVNNLIKEHLHLDQPTSELLSNEDRDDYRELLDPIIENLSSNTLFNTSSLFDPESVPAGLKDEFRSRFKNVSAIMDCVGCDRCRMWGKLQTIGYGTALKILFESEDPINAPRLKFRRIELVALINTFDRLSKSIEAINNFKGMYLEHLNDVENGLAKLGDYEKTHGHGDFDFPFFSVPDVSKLTSEKLKSQSKQQVFSTDENKDERSPRRNRSFKEEWNAAMDEVYEALCFVLNSYWSFPSTIYKITLVKLNSWWDDFISKRDLSYQELFPLHDEFDQNISV